MPKFRNTRKSDFKHFLYLFNKLIFNKWVKLFLFLFILFNLFSVALFFVHRPVVQKDINYGINFSNKYASELGMDWKRSYIEILDGLNVKNIRLVAYWDEVEKTNNVYDFSNIIWQIEEAEKRDINIILAVGQKVPRYPECHTPSWYKQIENEQEKNEELYNYVQDIVNETKKYESIKMWQIENEPFFPFGECEKANLAVLKTEINKVREIDSRPILVQDSGEGGFWFVSYRAGDYLGISMYRRIWYDFWGAFLGKFIYFKYPLAHWTYKIKADFAGVPYQKVIVTELQAEPWGPGINNQLTENEKDKTMSKNKFLATINYAQKAGFSDLYFWGAEWWLWEKDYNENPYFFETAKAVINY
jgi:hypothetical protein